MNYVTRTCPNTTAFTVGQVCDLPFFMARDTRALQIKKATKSLSPQKAHKQDDSDWEEF